MNRVLFNGPMCTWVPIIRICRNFADTLLKNPIPCLPCWHHGLSHGGQPIHGPVVPLAMFLFSLPFVCGPGVCCWSRQTGRRNSGILLGFAKSWKRMPDIDPLSPIRAIVSRSSKYGKPLESSLPGPKKTSWNSAAVMGPRTDRQKERFFLQDKMISEFILGFLFWSFIFPNICNRENSIMLC